ncbi:T9SS type A sorting domain-containing protein [Epilithonimonas arachidiradicis]|uniref:Putative secreted protein (Por secretion system target) n=1 Tax=Epilithonimonas arachidiradicis TaxID=1617282 RepID=A0A420CPR6_9FLAO|nr:T9SS type A sorting domain-containing protein [Epilithonimonas arachidiradicis]RKE80387.1 putative secreted protein (Por secretion system target) [Epilithonimonas arachidiradicis]GGG64067.1 hypothetical protein GCM10007332_27950 [Epilithonimonas arachidiradicis]
MKKIYLLKSFLLVVCLIIFGNIETKGQNLTLNFDEPFGTRSWTEDGYNWSWDMSGWDNIRNYNPKSGTGHGATASEYSSKLSTTKNINIYGVWIYCFISNTNDLEYFNLKGYDINGNVLYSKSLPPSTFFPNSGYIYIDLNWTNVKSFAVEYKKGSQATFSPAVYYDDLVYSINETLSAEDASSEEVSIYPNPVKKNLIIDTKKSFLSVEIYNASGQLLKVSNSKNIDLSKLEKGNYVVKIKTENNVISKKIIKE